MTVVVVGEGTYHEHHHRCVLVVIGIGVVISGDNGSEGGTYWVMMNVVIMALWW